ncbi:zeta toxin family protein [Nonomuraea sp. NPDC050202]|uniref:zeta toxin family protein n=1 Tax=Nonomuraea sp. NPDC050202 TaxID=3155035 RepID=UPI0033D34A17
MTSWARPLVGAFWGSRTTRLPEIPARSGCSPTGCFEQARLAEVSGLSPMEASGLVHEESSHVAKQIAGRALEEGKDVLWDITMASPSSVESRVDALRAAGYRQVDAVFVDIPVEMSVARHWEEPGTFPVDDLMARQLHDPPPDVPGSVDDLNLAYARGHLSAEEYDYLADAAIDSMRAQEEGSG